MIKTFIIAEAGVNHNGSIELAKNKGIKIIGFTGRIGRKMKNLCDILFNVPADDTGRIQECHLFLEHNIVELVEQKLFGEKK